MPRADDPYLLPNGTLQNKLGIKNAAELQRREGELAAARENVLLNNLPRPPFTYATLKRVHRDLFQDVYDWAGQQRTGSLRKAAHDGPSSPENLFAPPDAIAPRLDRLFGKLAADSNLTGLSRTAFAAGATEVLAEINSVHFAREGNGRAQRLLLTAIAANAGHSLAFDIITRERMVAVSIAAHGGDTAGMRRMLTRSSTSGKSARCGRPSAFSMPPSRCGGTTRISPPPDPARATRACWSAVPVPTS